MSQRIYEEILFIASKSFDYKSDFTSTVYRLLMHSTSRKRAKLRIGKFTSFPALDFLKINKDRLGEFLLDKFHLEFLPAESHLLKKNDLTLKDFDTAYVFKELQEVNTPREAIPMLNRHYSELSPSQVEQIEHAFWESLNEHILDVARNIVASVQAKRKVLSTLPEMI